MSALLFLADVCDGDARRALMAFGNRSSIRPTRGRCGSRGSWPKSRCNARRWHTTPPAMPTTTPPAPIKSIRGSDPDAAIYWLARMLEGGEDVRFLCRRLVILASEDVGNADPQALSLAVSAMQACEFIGLPECQLTLAQAVTYLACAPKSNAATVAIGEARRDIREGRLLPVPVHLRDTHYRGAEQLGHGTDYQYSHNAEHGVAEQDYLGVEREYYRPVDRGAEKELAQRLPEIRARLRGTIGDGENGIRD